MIKVKTMKVFIKTMLLAACAAYAGSVEAQRDSIYWGEDSCYSLQIRIYAEHAEYVKLGIQGRTYRDTVYMPAIVDGKPVTKICAKMSGGYYSGGYYGSGNFTATMVIPATVSEIGDEAFASLNAVKVAFANNSCLKKIGKKAFASIQYSNKVLELPETVEEIGEDCFYHLDELIRVKLPSTLKTIPNGAFNGCDDLEECELPQTLESIGDYAFNNCRWYTPAFPESLKTIGRYAFANTSGGYMTIPQNVTSIGEYAFSKSEFLYEATLPEGLKSIAKGLFYDCQRLRKVYIPQTVTSIGQEAFSNCTALTKADIPDDVTNIGPYAFNNCQGLASIKLPSKLMAIQNSSFCNCNSIKSIVIPSRVTSIGYSAFYNCGQLDSLIMPEGITTIGEKAFRYCKVDSFDLSDSLRTIGIEALPTARFYVIPPLVESIGRDAFPTEVDFIVLETEHYVSLEQAINQRWVSESYYPKKLYVPFSVKADYENAKYKIAQEGITAYDPKASKEIVPNLYYTFRNATTGQYLQLSAKGETETALVGSEDMRSSAGAQVRLVESGTANKYYLSIQNSADPMLGTLNFKGNEALVDHPAFRQWNLMVDGLYMAVDDKGNFVKTDVANDNADWYVSPATEFDVKMTNGYDGKSYAAIYLPFDVQAYGDTHIYVATSSDNQSVTMTELVDGKLKNNEGALVVDDSGDEVVTVQITSRVQTPETNQFVGSCEDRFSVSAQDEYFGLEYTANDGIGLYSLETPVLKANTAYLPRTSANGNALFLQFNLQNITDGIQAVNDDHGGHKDLMYDLRGRIIQQKPQGGIYIMNGRKYFEK